MKIVSFIKELIRAQDFSAKDLSFFIYRICISLVNCKEYTIDSFIGRSLADIDFAKCDLEKGAVYPWQKSIIHLERILALWSWEREQRFSKHVESGTALLKTFAHRAHSPNTKGRARGSIFQSSYIHTPPKA